MRIAGSVIVRQRPGTAEGFVFLSLEDETGIANVIVTPSFFDKSRARLAGAPFLLIEGAVLARARRGRRLPRGTAAESHDSH